MDGILRDGKVKTRKNHKCHGCLELIPKGTEIYSQTFRYEGKLYTIYECKTCQDWCKGCRDCYDSEDAFEGFKKECMREAANAEEVHY